MPKEEITATERTVAADGPVMPRASHASLVVIHGGEVGQRIKLDKPEIVIGRTPDCDLPINQGSISRRHCQIVRDGGEYKLRDMDSTNHTYLNEQPVIEAWLSDGDHITVGQTVLKFVGVNNPEARFHSEMHKRSVLDALTGLNNRRFFISTLEREIARAQRRHRVFSVALLDLDLFKQVNDTLGHLAGDAVLRGFCRVVNGRIRKDDVAARIGGEEFALLLPETGLEDAMEVAESLRQVVADHDFIADDKPVKITVSLGCVQWDAGMRNYSDVLRAADTALYKAKDAGRNCVRTLSREEASSDEPSTTMFLNRFTDE